MAGIKTKTCTKCREEKDLSCFRSRGGSEKHLLKSNCNKCLYEAHKEWLSENPDKIKEYRYKDPWTLAKRCKRRGITPEELITAFESQNKSCPICLEYISLKDSAIDHNHITNEFRGLLCKQCNRALGMFKDDPEILERAMVYLKINGHYGGGYRG